MAPGKRPDWKSACRTPHRSCPRSHGRPPKDDQTYPAECTRAQDIVACPSGRKGIPLPTASPAFLGHLPRTCWWDTVLYNMWSWIDINPANSIITSNVNGRNTSIKRQHLLEWIKKKKSKTQLYVEYKKPNLILRTQVGEE